MKLILIRGLIYGTVLFILTGGIALLSVFGALGSFGELFFTFLMLLMTVLVKPFGAETQYGGFASFLSGSTAIFAGWISLFGACLALALLVSLLIACFKNLFKKKG